MCDFPSRTHCLFTNNLRPLEMRKQLQTVTRVPSSNTSNLNKPTNVRVNNLDKYCVLVQSSMYLHLFKSTILPCDQDVITGLNNLM